MKTSLSRQLIAAALAFAMLILLVSLQACGDASSKNQQSAPATAPRTSAVYTLAPQQTVALGPNASVRLDHVNDSRCQPGKVCVWAGYLSYSMTVHGPSGDTSFVLADATPNVPRTVTQQGLTFALENNDDEMTTAAGSAAPDYRVSLRVTIPATRLRAP